MKNVDQDSRVQNSGQRFRAVAQSSRHDGIGNALRQAYDPGAPSLPDDLKALLARLG